MCQLATLLERNALPEVFSLSQVYLVRRQSGEVQFRAFSRSRQFSLKRLNKYAFARLDGHGETPPHVPHISP